MLAAAQNDNQKAFYSHSGFFPHFYGHREACNASEGMDYYVVNSIYGENASVYNTGLCLPKSCNFPNLNYYLMVWAKIIDPNFKNEDNFWFELVNWD